MRKNLTEGSIISSIIALSIPVLIGNLLQTAYQIIDTFWVGRLGAEAVAAVSLSFPIIFLFITISGGIGLGGAVLVSQYIGNKNKEKANKVTGQIFLLALIVSFIFGIFGYVLTPGIIKLLGAQGNVIPFAISYLRYSFIGLIFVFGYMVFQSISRAAGDAKTPMYIVLFTVILNLILDPLFIFGYGGLPAYGVAGAAIATLITQGLALIFGLSVFFGFHDKFFQGYIISLSLSDFKFNKQIIKKIIKLGVPVSLEQSSRSLGFLIITGIVASFGTITLAAYGIGMRLISLVIIPALSLSIANSALVGQNIGAGKSDRAKKILTTSIKIGFVILSLIGVLFFIFAESLSAIFIPGDLKVIKLSGIFLRVSSLFFGFFGIQMAIIGALRGSGNTTSTMKIAFFVMLIQIFTAYFASGFIGELGLWIAFPFGNVCGAIYAYFIFKKSNWFKKKII